MNTLAPTPALAAASTDRLVRDRSAHRPCDLHQAMQAIAMEWLSHGGYQAARSGASVGHRGCTPFTFADSAPGRPDFIDTMN